MGWQWWARGELDYIYHMQSSNIKYGFSVISMCWLRFTQFSFSIVHEVLVEANVNCHASNYIYTNATTWWSLLILFNSSLSVTPLYDLFPQVPFPPTSLLPSSNNDQILPPLVTINPPFFRQWSMLLDINFCSFSYYDHW